MKKLLKRSKNNDLNLSLLKSYKDSNNYSKNKSVKKIKIRRPEIAKEL